MTFEFEPEDEDDEYDGFDYLEDPPGLSYSEAIQAFCDALEPLVEAMESIDDVSDDDDV